MKIFKIKFSFDWLLIILPLILAVSGLATLYSITSITGKSSLVLNQGIYLILGAAVYIFFSVLDYRLLKSYGKYFYVIGIILLLIVELFGTQVFGSTRWIDLGFTQIQPSEIMKLFLLVLLAASFSKEKELTMLQTIGVLFFIALPVFLILREPDLGTALSIIATTVGLFIFSPIPKKILIGIVIVVIAASPLVWFNLKPYQKQRLTTFINPYSDPLGSGYNVNQAKIAVGSGGLFGKGFSGATQSQLQFLPVAHIDFIFSGWAEATGFLGSLMIVVVFALLIWRIFRIAYFARDNFGYFLAIGAGFLILFQSFVNIGMNIGIMPVTGIPLPLMSYGGTSIITTSAILGIVQSINLRRTALRFD